MPEDRLLRILVKLKADKDHEREPRRLCEVSADVLSVTGAGVMLMSGDLARGSLCSSNPVSALIEELQFTLGEGPCIDAYRYDIPVLEPDLVEGGARWTVFTPRAVAAGVHAIFGFPLQIGAVRLGALNAYRDLPGPLSEDQHADALVMSGLIVRSIIAMQADAPLGELSSEIEAGADLHLVVHQATGVVSHQLDVGVTEALIRLRAYAFAHDRTVSDVARDIVEGGLRLD